MASKNQLIGGNFQDLLGNILSNGYILMQLSQDAVTTDGTQVSAGKVVSIPLDVSGDIVVSPVQSVWPNDVLLPSGTFYIISVYSSAGELVWGPNWQQVPSTPSPYNVGNWVPNVVSIVGGGGTTLVLQTNGVSNAVQTLLNLVAGNGITLTNVGGTVTISQGPVFSIVSFVCDKSGNYEIGQVVSSPSSFTASYTVTPTSASISDGTNSVNLFSPFTSGSLAHSYSLSSAGTVTFTLTAIGPTTQTAITTMNFLPRTFGGVGTAGATGATASSTNAILSGATGTLASAGLNNQNSYGPYTASSQKIYILMIGGSHTFKDTSTGFGFAMNTPTAISFTNQNGDMVSMYLYESTNPVIGTVTLALNT